MGRRAIPTCGLAAPTCRKLADGWDRAPHVLRFLRLIAAEPGWDGREEAQEAQEGVEFDPGKGAVVEERSGLGDEVARALAARFARFAPYRG